MTSALVKPCGICDICTCLWRHVRSSSNTYLCHMHYKGRHKRTKQVRHGLMKPVQSQHNNYEHYLRNSGLGQVNRCLAWLVCRNLIGCPRPKEDQTRPGPGSAFDPLTGSPQNRAYESPFTNLMFCFKGLNQDSPEPPWGANSFGEPGRRSCQPARLALGPPRCLQATSEGALLPCFFWGVLLWRQTSSEAMCYTMTAFGGS